VRHLKSRWSIELGKKFVIQLSISSTFYERVFCTKVLFLPKVTREKLRKALSHEKCRVKH